MLSGKKEKENEKETMIKNELIEKLKAEISSLTDINKVFF